MFDLHTHILPGVDDGSTGIEESIKIIKDAASEGTVGFVATPHANLPEYLNLYDSDLEKRFDQLRKAVKDAGIKAKIFEGQEIYCSGAVLTYLRQGKLITINASRYLLVEFAFNESVNSITKKLFQLKAEGYVPIVAHPERYDIVKQTTQNAVKMKQAGALLQINADSVMGNLGQGAFNAALRLLDRRLADIMASDCHSPFSRNACMGTAEEFVAERCSLDYCDLLLRHNTKAILKNERI